MNAPRTFRKKPVEIEAVQLHASETDGPLTFGGALPDWLSLAFEDGTLERRSGDSVNGGDWDFVAIKTLEGTMLAGPGDWIIRGVQGELYPCKPDIFAQTYDEVEGGRP